VHPLIIYFSKGALHMNIKHEIISDIPLIIEFCKKLNLQYIVDIHLKTHGNQEGLTNGQIVLGWIAHILTQNNHCKAPVQEWQNKHKMTLQALLGTEILDTDFEDSRLSRLLERFADDSMWHNLEEAFYKDSFSILQLDTQAPEYFKETPSIEDGIAKTIKIDATTAYGYHEVIENGIMQRGWSKDHRSDLPQLKIMVAVEGNTGFQLASDVVPGNKNDDPLYIPVLERTRKIIDTSRSLICGDCKMSALYTRANMVKNKEFYLTPMQLNNSAKELLDALVDKIVDGDQNAELIIDIDNKNIPIIIGAGFEISRNQLYKADETMDDIEWNERVLLVRSYDHAEQEIRQFDRKITKIKEELLNLESNLCDNEEDTKNDLFRKIEKIKIKNNNLSDFFDFKIDVIVDEKEVKRSEKRNGKTRNGSFKIKRFRSRIVDVSERKDKIENMKYKIGWRIYVTNAKKETLNFSSAYKFFRKTMYVIEIGFHVLKDYINISPLFVRQQNQILGMTRLLMLALKILTLMTAEVRANMKKEKIVLKGLYAGQPARKHSAPTAQSLLEYFSRQNIALIGHRKGEQWEWLVTSLTDTCREVLKLLKIPESIYERLPELLKG
jgi:transposase